MNRLEKAIHKGGQPTVNKHLKRCLTALVISKMQ